MNQVLKKANHWFLVVALMFVGLAAQAQDSYTLTGVVSSADEKTPLPGANVTIVGTSTGTITDFDGKYNLEVKQGDKIAVSFVGYETQTIEITGQKTQDVTLAVSTGMQLSDVVVVGYGVQKKSHLTGSVEKLDDKRFADTPVSRADEALAGKVSGVQISSTDASAGASPQILVRGISSISASTSPLIVVDGFPIPGDLSTVDMNDVASIEILKDAASSAIYGSRASNGVIIITTKTGKKGKISFDVNITAGTKQAYTRDDLYPSISSWVDDMTALGWASDASGQPYVSGIKEMADNGFETNWQDEALRTGQFTKYQLGASGGGEWGNFYIGGSYLQDKGILRLNDYKKFSLRANVNAKLTERIEVGMQVSGNSYTRNLPNVGFHDMLRTQPWLPVYHTEQSLALADWNSKDKTRSAENVKVGDLTKETDYDFYLSDNVNSTAKLLGREREYSGKEFMTNSYLKINIIEGLAFKTSLGAYYRTSQRWQYQNSWAHKGGQSQANSVDYNSQTTSILNENILTYNKKVGAHSFDLLGGFTYQEQNGDVVQINGTNYPNDLIKGVEGAAAVSLANSYKSKDALVSGLFRVNYALMDKYLVSVTARTDGSSRFGSETRWGWFPSVSLGWRVSEEKFMKSQDFVSSLKIRATYGTTGSNSIADYATISNLSSAPVAFGDVVSSYSADNVANPILKWERAVETNLGFDLGMVDNRFNLSFNYYITTKDNLLLPVPTPTVTGFSEALQNAGTLKTNGFEIDFTSTNVATDNFTWKTTFNISHNKNEVVEYPNASITPSSDSKRPSYWAHFEGQPLNQFYGYVVESEISPEQLKEPYKAVGVTAQHVHVKDLDGDGQITDADRTTLGSPYPDFIYGITNEFTYKDFDFSFLVTGSQGAEVMNYDRFYYESQWKGSYTSDVDESDLKVKATTDYFIEDASYITLRNVTFGYTAPKTIANKLGIDGLRAFISAQNLLYKWADDYTSFNPEAQNYQATYLTTGAQRGATPIARTFTVGLNLKF